MSVRIVDVREVTKPIASAIRNAYIDFSKMTTSLVAVVTNVERNGKPVVGYGFNSNGRYGQGGLIRERFAKRLTEADPATLLDASGDNLDPDKVWAALMTNEKPGGHGERSVAVGTIDMAVLAIDHFVKIVRRRDIGRFHSHPKSALRNVGSVARSFAVFERSLSRSCYFSLDHGLRSIIIQYDPLWSANAFLSDRKA